MPMTFERSKDTDSVITVLRGVNSEITYLLLAKQAGLSLARTKQVLTSARRVLFNESAVLFGVNQGVGLRRLTDSEKTKKPAQFLRRVQRGSGRELKHLESVNMENLTNQEQVEATTTRTVLNAIRQQSMVRPEPQKPDVAKAPLPDILRIVGKN